MFFIKIISESLGEIIVDLPCCVVSIDDLNVKFVKLILVNSISTCIYLCIGVYPIVSI